MKKYILSIVLLTAILLPCFGQGINVEVLEFRKQDNFLLLNAKIEMNAATVARYQGLTITFGVETPDSLLLLPTFTVLGSNRERVITRFFENRNIDYLPFEMEPKSDTSYLYSVKIPYRNWFDDARLSVRHEVGGYRGHNVVTYFRMSDRVEREIGPEIVQKVVIAEERVPLVAQPTARVGFLVDCITINPALFDNANELAAIEKAIRTVTDNPDATLLRIHLTGFASPEYRYEHNYRLARNRTLALKNHIKSQFDLPDDVFRISYVAEDWHGLVEMIQEVDVPHKAQVLDIINNVGIFDGREEKLRALENGVPFRFMFDNLFPQLRRTEFKIEYVIN
jgi:hypothetical protein